MVDNDMLAAMRQMMKEEIAPVNQRLDKLETGQKRLEKRLSKVEDRVDYVATVLEGALGLQDQLEERVKVLEQVI